MLPSVVDRSIAERQGCGSECLNSAGLRSVTFCQDLAMHGRAAQRVLCMKKPFCSCADSIKTTQQSCESYADGKHGLQCQLGRLCQALEAMKAVEAEKPSR